jgi:hypothetical protein
MWVEFAGRELSSKPDLEFRLNEATSRPELWLYSPGYATNFEVIFSKPHVKLATIPSYDEEIIKDIALAKVKITLGQIRSIYGSVPVANTTMSLNGPALVQEGTAALERAEEKLMKSEAILSMEWV